MSFLADASIKQEMDKGNLVTGGDKKMVSQCAYQFRAGKIFIGGPARKMVDWTNSTPTAPNAPFQIEPGAMIWVRMLEGVKLPADICATWWQTNTLSRKGIMLANMSLVDPGYEGPLACLFVNFGKHPVLIYDATPMAKLQFMRASSSVEKPASYPQDLKKYDFELEAMAANGASSFLRVGELSAELDVKKDTILRQLTLALEDEKKKFVNDFVNEGPKALIKTFTWAAAGFVILVLAMTFIPWLQSLVQPNLRESVIETVDSRLMEHAIPPRPPSHAEIEQLKASNQEILKKLSALSEKLAKLASQSTPK